MDSLNGSYDKGRSPSYGAGRGAGPAGAGRGSTFRGTEFNAKTRLCNRWLSPEGCRFGDRCNFAHGEQELRSMPPRSPEGFQGGPPAGGAPGRGGYAPRGRGGYGYGPGRGAGGRAGPGRGGYGYPSGGYGYGMGGGEGGYGGGDMGSSGGGQGRGGMSEEAWAQSGYPTTGPNGWIMYKDKATGDSYFHNGRTGVTQWDRPTDWPA